MRELVLFGGANAAAAVLGNVVSRPALSSRWYRRLRKPSYQPPAWAFGPVWSALYALSALSAARVFRARRTRARRQALRWWAAQWGFNAAWSPIFFGQRNPIGALADSVLLLGAAAIYARKAARADRAAAVLMLPYVGWAAFAVALNAGIVSRNAGTGRLR